MLAVDGKALGGSRHSDRDGHPSSAGSPSCLPSPHPLSSSGADVSLCWPPTRPTRRSISCPTGGCRCSRTAGTCRTSSAPTGSPPCSHHLLIEQHDRPRRRHAIRRRPDRRGLRPPTVPDRRRRRATQPGARRNDRGTPPSPNRRPAGTPHACGSPAVSWIHDTGYGPAFEHEVGVAGIVRRRHRAEHAARPDRSAGHRMARRLPVWLARDPVLPALGMARHRVRPRPRTGRAALPSGMGTTPAGRPACASDP